MTFLTQIQPDKFALVELGCSFHQPGLEAYLQISFSVVPTPEDLNALLVLFEHTPGFNFHSPLPHYFLYFPLGYNPSSVANVVCNLLQQQGFRVALKVLPSFAEKVKELIEIGLLPVDFLGDPD